MKRTKKASYFLFGVITTLLLVNMVVPALAIGLEKLISVSTGVNIYADGVKLDPKDANGNPVDVFIYNGTTYLPVRAVSDALGVPVQWDGNTRSVYLGTQPGTKQYLLTVCPPYQTSGFNNLTTVTMAGEKYANCCSIRGKGFALFNLNGQYNTLSFDVGHIDGVAMSGCEFNIYLDGVLALSVDLTGEMLPEHYEIPLNGALQMKFEEASRYGGYYGIANIEIE